MVALDVLKKPWTDRGRSVFPLLALYLVNSHDGAVLGQLPLGIITCHFSSTKRGGFNQSG